MKKLLICTIALLLLLSSCSKKEPEKFTEYYFDYFDTATTIVGYSESRDEFDAVCEKIRAALEEYHRLYTIYTRYDGINNLYKVNNSDGEVTVDKKIVDMLAFAKEAYY